MVPGTNLLLVFFLLLLSGPGWSAEAMQVNQVAVQIHAQTDSVVPGKAFWAAVSLKPDRPWKIYWRNPGDTGLPTALHWQLPDGGNLGENRWPVPSRFEFQGLVSYGFDDEAVILTRVTPPIALNQGDRFSLRVSVSWLACDDTCVRGNADLALSLPVVLEEHMSPSQSGEKIAAALESLPETEAPMQARFEDHAGQLKLTIISQEPLFADLLDAVFFPWQQDLISSSIPAAVRSSPSRLELVMSLEETDVKPDSPIQGVLVLHGPQGGKAYLLALTSTPPALPFLAATIEGRPKASLPYVILLASIGGLLLNLMPCVFPVLSLKAIGLVESSNLPVHHRRRHGIAYTLGVMSFFAAVGGVLMLLKFFGSSVGWGFQLQTPWFVALLVYLLFVLGLNLSGLINIGSSTMGIGESLTRKSGYSGSFFTGALAAVVASPCTAPFMGSAVAFALTQPPVQSTSIFLALAFGMALPFLLIAYVPNVGRILPRPGPWMNTFKQAMAFPLYLTAIWLLWVLGRETDITVVALVLVGMLLLLLAVWLHNLGAAGRSLRSYLRMGVATVALVAAIGLLGVPAFHPGAAAVSINSAEFWQPYSAVRLAELRQQNRPVFVNMTADWCISCIANERVALSMPSVRAAFKEKGIVPLKGDWTNNDPEVGRVIESFNRQGVPLYVLYPKNSAPPVLLPQWLTPFNVLEALEAI